MHVNLFKNLGLRILRAKFQKCCSSLSDVHKQINFKEFTGFNPKAVNSPALFNLPLATPELASVACSCFTKLRWSDLNRPQMSSFNSFKMPDFNKCSGSPT